MFTLELIPFNYLKGSLNIYSYNIPERFLGYSSTFYDQFETLLNTSDFLFLF